MHFILTVLLALKIEHEGEENYQNMWQKVSARIHTLVQYIQIYMYTCIQAIYMHSYILLIRYANANANARVLLIV